MHIYYILQRTIRDETPIVGSWANTQLFWVQSFLTCEAKESEKMGLSLRLFLASFVNVLLVYNFLRSEMLFCSIHCKCQHIFCLILREWHAGIGHQRKVVRLHFVHFYEVNSCHLESRIILKSEIILCGLLRFHLALGIWFFPSEDSDHDNANESNQKVVMYTKLNLALC